MLWLELTSERMPEAIRKAEGRPADLQGRFLSGKNGPGHGPWARLRSHPILQGLSHTAQYPPSCQRRERVFYRAGTSQAGGNLS